MRPRQVMGMYQTLARVWLTAAGLSLLLPASTRLGWWVPLHLALLGAVSVAISGAMQNFVAALTSSPPTPPGVVWAQLVLVNAGAALIVAGRAAGIEPLIGAGGTAFLAATLLLGWTVLHARRRSLHLRHPVPVAMYEAAVLCVLAGGAIGIALATGGVHYAKSLVDLRSAHMTLNVLGWVSLTIAGTLITLLPTVLRVRMPAWSGVSTRWLLTGGVVVSATGMALGSGPIAAGGAVAFACGGAGLFVMVRRAAASRRMWPVPLSAKHLLFALAWFAAGSVWFAAALVHGVDWFAGATNVFVLVFVCGWILQTLLGAWLYLLPMSRPGHPGERRAQLAAIEWGGAVELVALNGGVAMLAVAAALRGASGVAAAGAVLALAGAGLALVKAWAFPALGRVPALARRGRAVWDPAARGS